MTSASGEKTKPLTAIKAIYEIKTTHPCQVLGNPHPHPYRFAGNQYFLVSDIGFCFLFQAEMTEASRCDPIALSGWEGKDSNQISQSTRGGTEFVPAGFLAPLEFDSSEGEICHRRNGAIGAFIANIKTATTGQI